MFPADDDDSGIGDVPSARTIGIEVAPDLGTFRNADVFIQDCAAHGGMAPDVAIVHDDTALDEGAGMDTNAASENGLSNDAAGKNASTGDDAVQRLPTAVGLVENELGRRIRITCAAHRPVAVVKIEFGFDVVEVHIRFVVRLNGAHIPPIWNGIFSFTGNSVGLEIVRVYESIARKLRQNVLAEIMMTVEILCIGLEQIEQTAGGKDVIAHRGVDTAGITGHRRRVRALFMKGQNPSTLIGLDDTKFGCKFSGEWVGGDGDFRAFGNVKIDHAGNVHAVDMIATEYRHQLRIGLFDKIDVLKYRIGSALVPCFILGTHLGGNVDDEMALEQSAKLPSFAEVLKQGLAAELGQHVNRVNAGVDEVAEDEIDDPVLAPEGDRGLGTFPREWIEPRTFAAGKYDSEHPRVQGFRQKQFTSGVLSLRQSAPPGYSARCYQRAI